MLSPGCCSPRQRCPKGCVLCSLRLWCISHLPISRPPCCVAYEGDLVPWLSAQCLGGADLAHLASWASPFFLLILSLAKKCQVGCKYFELLQRPYGLLDSIFNIFISQYLLSSCSPVTQCCCSSFPEHHRGGCPWTMNTPLTSPSLSLSSLALASFWNTLISSPF